MSSLAVDELPVELVNLLALHSSFLTALSLHYAHNGTSTPVDLRNLMASTTLVWRQRQVTLDDVRLLLSVLSSGPAGADNPYYLSDYGCNKICLELKEASSILNGMMNVNEQALHDMFRVGLNTLWSQWSCAQKIPAGARVIATPRGRCRPKKGETKQVRIEAVLDDAAVLEFLAHIPLAGINMCASLNALTPLQEKGKKRLRDFKESVQLGRAPKKAREAIGKENDSQCAQAKITQFAAVRKTNLLDRILAKQEAARAGSIAPSPAEMRHRTALQRASEIMGILSLLCASRPGTRVSFSMVALIQALQSSLRTPISKEEAVSCIEVLASEVAPGYISIVHLGAISSVVVNQTMRPIDFKSRLLALGAV